MSFSSLEQQTIREDIFRWLDEQMFLQENDEFTRDKLASYRHRGKKLPLIDRTRGIRNPADFDATLSVLTSASRNTGYVDEIRPDGLIRYSYQAKDGGDNVKLRRAYVTKVPIVYFQGIRPGVFRAYYPTYVVHDNPVERVVYLAQDESFTLFSNPFDLGQNQRRYVERTVKSRLHQRAFRTNVLRAYKATCSVCLLKQPELLDAAHIVPDNHDLGVAEVPNGLALCKLHHAAYDTNLMGITQDFEIRLRSDLQEKSPVETIMKVNFLDLHGKRLHLPAARNDYPDQALLARRFEAFAN